MGSRAPKTLTLKRFVRHYTALFLVADFDYHKIAFIRLLWYALSNLAQRRLI